MRARLGSGPLVVAVVAVLGTAGCDALSPSGSITYRVTGAGSTQASLITYEAEDGAGSQVSDVALPWSFFRSVRPGDFMYVSAQNANAAGCITAEIREGSTVLHESTSCGAFVIATASGSYK